MHGRQLGELIAVGGRSLVYAWGDDAVIKVPLPTTPDSWIRYEASYAEAIHATGASVPRVLGVETVDGRQASVFERVHGRSMWSAIAEQPSQAAAFGRQLAGLQLALFDVVPPMSLPAQRDRLRCKIRNTAMAAEPLARLALILATSSDGPPRLCHGDLHPGNVILGAKGAVIVDWFDVSRGHALGDVARTSLLLGRGRHEQVPHLPSAPPGVLRELHDAHLAEICTHMDIDEADLEEWRAIGAAAQLAEAVEPWVR